MTLKPYFKALAMPSEHISILSSSTAHEWNEWVAKEKEKDPEFGPSLAGEDLTDFNFVFRNFPGAFFMETNLSGVDLSSADFSDATLLRANFSNCRGIFTSFKRANISQADFSNSDFKTAEFTGANLFATNLSNANLVSANFSSAYLRFAKLFKADIAGTDLSGADLRDCKGFVLDENFIKETKFSPNSKDPWSQLRRKYTGVMVFFNLIFLSIFVGSNAIEAFFWKGVNILQSEYNEYSTDNPEKHSTWKIPTVCLSENCAEPRPIWQIIIGAHKGITECLLIILLIAYNLARALFTWWVGLLRDAEERSNYSPSKKQYIWWYRVHLILYPLGMATSILVLSVYGADLFFDSTVILPQ
jgi:hypothetical protein